MRHLTRCLLPLALAAAGLASPLASAGPAHLPPALKAAMHPYLVQADVDPRALDTWDEDYASTLDLSADGIADWVVDFDALGFPGWCGTGGCRHQVWVSQGTGYVRALDEWVVDVALRVGTAHTLDVELHGSFCREPGNAPCSRSFQWNPVARQLEEVPNAEGGSLLTGPLFQPVPTEEAEWPEILQRLRDSVVDRCSEAGGDSMAWNWPASSIPDIDGDGVRDWVLDESWLLCDRGEDDSIDVPARLHVFVSNHGRWTEKLDVPDAEWAVDVSSRPASLVITPTEW